MNHTLFPKAFFAELARLRGRQASRSMGERPEARAGNTLPGFERRGWQRGDHRSQVDWRATARAGQTMVRCPELERGGLLCLVLDRSASLAPGSSDRDSAQRRLALALSWLALEQGARVLLFPGMENPVGFSGWARRAAVASFLEELAPPKGTDALAALRKRPAAGSVLHVLSDPWLEEDALRSWAEVTPTFRERHWTTLILEQEISPPRERLEVEGAEDGQRLVVDLDRGFADYRRSWESFRRAQIHGLHRSGFIPMELSCLTAETDAVDLLRRASALGVL